MGSYDDDYRPVSPRVEREANRLADSPDSGNTRNTISALQREMQTMCPQEFKAMLGRATQLDDKGLGDNLRVSRDGDIILQDRNYRDMRIGNIYQQEQCWQERQAALQQQQIPDRPVVIEGQAGQYYDPNQGYYRERMPQRVYVEPQQQYYQDPRFIPQPRYGVVGGNPYYGRQDPITSMAEGALLGGAFSSITGGRFGRGAAAGGVLGLILNGRGW